MKIVQKIPRVMAGFLVLAVVSASAQEKDSSSMYRSS
jgi:hypothetical protein